MTCNGMNIFFTTYLIVGITGDGSYPGDAANTIQHEKPLK